MIVLGYFLENSFPGANLEYHFPINMDISWTEEITLLSEICGHLETAFEGIHVSQEMAMFCFLK